MHSCKPDFLKVQIILSIRHYTLVMFLIECSILIGQWVIMKRLQQQLWCSSCCMLYNLSLIMAQWLWITEILDVYSWYNVNDPSLFFAKHQNIALWLKPGDIDFPLKIGSKKASVTQDKVSSENICYFITEKCYFFLCVCSNRSSSQINSVTYFPRKSWILCCLCFHYIQVLKLCWTFPVSLNNVILINQ